MMNIKRLTINQLVDLVRAMDEYGTKTGKYYSRPRKIAEDLKNPDPFVIQEARIAAYYVLEDTLLYH